MGSTSDDKYCPVGSSGTVFLTRAAAIEAAQGVAGLDGEWHFQQFWSHGSEVQQLDGTCTIEIDATGAYDFQSHWMRGGQEKSSAFLGA